MDAYLKVVQTLAKDFKFFELTKVPRGENVCANALAALGSRLRDKVKQTIPIHKIDKPSIELPPSEVTVVAPITEAIPMDEDPAAEQTEVLTGGQNSSTIWSMESYLPRNGLQDDSRQGVPTTSSWMENSIDGPKPKYS